jgi:hypothetical protein
MIADAVLTPEFAGSTLVLVDLDADAAGGDGPPTPGA